ncbi:hypothetical protein BS78_01G328600 [Paspalum vaginatum]|nr:hypothetical protein BS78_01G328600 [Paspalum vaginatum]
MAYHHPPLFPPSSPFSHPRFICKEAWSGSSSSSEQPRRSSSRAPDLHCRLAIVGSSDFLHLVVAADAVNPAGRRL